MKYDEKMREQLVHELSELRSQNAELKKSTMGIISIELAAEEARHYAESIVETIREPLLVLDADLKIVSANRNFYTTFKVTPGETIGSLIYDLGNKQWDIPDLRKLLEEVLPEKQAFDDFEVDHIFQDIGHKVMLLNACRIHRKDIGAKMILLAVEDITERKRLESLLIDSELQYRRLFETASDGIVLLEKSEGKITHANPATEKMLGYNQKESIGSKLPDIGVSLDMDDFQTTMQNLNKSGIINYRNVTVETKSGQHIDTEVYLVDRAKLVQCNIRDITERKVAKKDLQESEDRYRSLFENSIDAILLTAPDGKIMAANSEACRIFGRTEEDIYQIGRAGLLDQSDPRLKVALEERKHTGRFRGELTFLRKNGTHFSGEISSSIFNDHDGKQLTSMSIRDITERKEAEDKIKKQTDAMESAIDGIAILNKDEGYIYLNQAHARIYGYENAGELIAKPWRTLYDSDQLQRFDAEIMPKFSKEGFWQGETLGMKRDGSKFPQEISLTALDGGGLICIVRDITKSKQAEKALQHEKILYEDLVTTQPSGVYRLRVKLRGDWQAEKWRSMMESTYSVDMASDRFCNILGISHEEFVANPGVVPDMIHLDDKQDFNAKNAQAMTSLTPFTWEGRISRHHQTRWVHLESIPRVLDSETVLWTGIVYDITERKRSEEELLRTLESLRKAVGTTIQVMVSAVEVRDPYTSGHQIRSADLASAIAMEMGLPQDKIEGIRMAGSIHDIGKLSIPAEILSKPTKLTNIEFFLIKEHSLKGYEILKDVESPWLLAQIVYQHHERMDGSGYPRNLKGDEILVEARIMAVADVVESMASHRPYRPSLGIEVALEEIEKNKGVLYDDSVADACLRLFREKGFQLLS